MIRGCIAAAAERGHTVLMAESQGDPHIESAAIESMLARGIDRIIFGTTGAKKLPVPRVLRGRHVVLMNCVSEGSPVPAVVPDEYAAGRLAASTLLDAGHTDRVWLVGEIPQIAWAGRRRIAGIRARLRSAGLSLAGHIECGWWPHLAREATAAAVNVAALASRRHSTIVSRGVRTTKSPVSSPALDTVVNFRPAVCARYPPARAIPGTIPAAVPRSERAAAGARKSAAMLNLIPRNGRTG